jgi:TRAP transporter TAXI family solute receptor
MLNYKSLHLFAFLIVLLFKVSDVLALEKSQSTFGNPMPDIKIDNDHPVSKNNPVTTKVPIAPNNLVTKKDIVVTTNKSVPKEKFINTNLIIIGTTVDCDEIGQTICSLVNYNQQTLGFKCSTKKSTGNSETLRLLNIGDIDFAIVSSNILYDKMEKSKKTNKDYRYKFVLSLYTEMLNILVKENSKIKNIDDLLGNIVDVGSTTSSASYVLQKISEAKGWSKYDFSGIEYIDHKAREAALCTGKTDATLIYTGTPSTLINTITTNCEINIIPVDKSLVTQLSYLNSFITEEIIPGGTYLSNVADVDTFGSPILIITKKDANKLMVYNLTKIILDNIELLGKIHPAFRSYHLSQFADNKGVVPYSKGAEILFHEKNLIPQTQKRAESYRTKM